MGDPEGKAAGVSESVLREHGATEAALAERRLRLEESFPKKWGNVLFGAAATVIVAMISATVTFIQTEQTERLRLAELTQAETQRQIANARTALELYFDNIEELSPGNDQAVFHLALIAEVSDLDQVRDVFYQMRKMVIENRRREDPDLTVAEAAAGLPTLRTERTYDPAEVTAYLQYPKGPGCLAVAEIVAEKLSGIGMEVPGLEAIAPDDTPTENEIRFYTTLQKTQMAELPAELQEATGLSFRSRVLAGNLPAGILEVWIGKSACAG